MSDDANGTTRVFDGFPDVLTRMHAATKPQVFGLLLVLSGVLLTLRSWDATLFGLMIVVLQIFTASVSSHMVARTAYRTGQWDSARAVQDDLAADLSDAGFVKTGPDEPDPPAGDNPGF